MVLFHIFQTLLLPSDGLFQRFKLPLHVNLFVNRLFNDLPVVIDVIDLNLVILGRILPLKKLAWLLLYCRLLLSFLFFVKYITLL